MNLKHKFRHGLTLFVLAIVVSPIELFAFEKLTNNTLSSSTHPAPVQTTRDPGTETAFPLQGGGLFLVERNLINGIKMWKFTVDEAFWWVTDRGIIWGANDVAQLPHANSNEQAYLVYLTLPRVGG